MPTDIYDYLHERYSFWQFFRQHFISGQLKVIKPDPAIFQMMISAANLVPAKCVFLDDSVANITTAAKLGFQTILVTSPLQAINDLRQRLSV